jgi:hypothetical protein
MVKGRLRARISTTASERGDCTNSQKEVSSGSFYVDKILHVPSATSRLDNGIA